MCSVGSVLKIAKRKHANTSYLIVSCRCGCEDESAGPVPFDGVAGHQAQHSVQRGAHLHRTAPTCVARHTAARPPRARSGRRASRGSAALRQVPVAGRARRPPVAGARLCVELSGGLGWRRPGRGWKQLARRRHWRQDQRRKRKMP